MYRGEKSVSISKLKSHLPMKVTEAATELWRAPGPVAGSSPLPTSHKEHWGSSPRSRKLRLLQEPVRAARSQCPWWLAGPCSETRTFQGCLFLYFYLYSWAHLEFLLEMGRRWILSE